MKHTAAFVYNDGWARCLTCNVRYRHETQPECFPPVLKGHEAKLAEVEAKVERTIEEDKDTFGQPYFEGADFQAHHEAVLNNKSTMYSI